MKAKKSFEFSKEFLAKKGLASMEGSGDIKFGKLFFQIIFFPL
jgi:hypothetical protein